MPKPSDFQEVDQATETRPVSDKKDPKGLDLLRKPFAANQISKLCKATKKDNPPGRCKDCGGWHKLPSVPLNYVGHAALTDRLLDADLKWSWEPVAVNPQGTPLLDEYGGMWIKLTVCGVTRLGYGDAQGKIGGDAMKERIGDALRNAAMRFGAALDLWHKGDLHVDNDDPEVLPEKVVKAEEQFQERTGKERASVVMVDAFQKLWHDRGKTDQQLIDVLRVRYSATRPDQLTKEELDELVKLAIGREPVEQTLKTSVAAISKTVYEPLPEERPNTPPKSSPGTVGRTGVTEKQLNRLYAISKAHSVSEADIHTYIKEQFGGMTSTKDLNRAEYDELCKWMESQ